jgi:hypothetical protein
MNISTLKKIVCVVAALLTASAASAGTLDASTAMPHTTTLTSANQTVAVKHIFAVGYYNKETFSCGIKVEFSDGSPAKNYSLTKSTTATQFIIDRAYQLSGTYSVSATGHAWGGMVACLGSQTSTTTILPMEAGKITALTTAHAAVTADSPDGIVVPFTILGTGTACTLQIYPHNQQDPKPLLVEVKQFPATVMIKFPHKPDDYKMLAWGTGVNACKGTAEADIKIRIKISIPKTPTITGLFLAPAVSHKAEAWRQDEAVDFYVEGNVNNVSDKAMQCGWTLFMVNSNGQGKKVTTGAKFNTGQIIPAAFFSAYEPGDYTMHVKSSALDDTNADADCAGEANKKFKLLRATATIKDVTLKAFAFHFRAASSDGDLSPGGEGGIYYGQFCENCNSIFSPAHDIGLLKIAPVFTAGQMCSYAVIQKFNGKQTSSTVIYTPNDPTAGAAKDAAPRLNVYSDNTTTVLVTLVGTSGPGGPCEGTVTKAITVHDDPKLPAVTK